MEQNHPRILHLQFDGPLSQICQSRKPVCFAVACWPRPPLVFCPLIYESMRFTNLIPAVATSAQNFAISAPDTDVQYSINVPESTASSGSGPIFFQMKAPSGTSWLGLGQGSSMSGSNIFMLYSDGAGGVTVSPRLGTGQRQPSYDSSSATAITVLSGSSSGSDGSLVANIRCDGCNSWSGGSMSPTDSSSSWIWAIKSGSPIDSTDLSENLQQHSTMGSMTIDLTQGVGGSSSNPFVASAGSSSAGGSSATSSAGSAPSDSAASTGASSSGSPSFTTSVVSQSGTASVTNIVPVATSSGSSSSTSTSTSSGGGPRAAHALIMSILFLLFFPLFALTLYLPWAKRVRFVHAPLQILSIILLIVGLATGVALGKKMDMLDGYHQVIGYIVVTCLIVFQPALGIYQHLYYHKTGGRSALGAFHQWLGRIVILAGVVNGGLGFLQSGPVGNEWVPRGAVIGYSIVAVVVFLFYVAVVFVTKRRGQSAPMREKPYDRGYEMHPSSRDNASPTNPNYESRNYPNHGQPPRYR